MQPIAFAALAVYAIGTLLVWPVWYFGGGYRLAKRYHGIDWREFNWIYFGRVAFWPYHFVRWIQRRRKGERLRAVVSIDGVEVRKYLSTADYVIDDRCMATTRKSPDPTSGPVAV